MKNADVQKIKDLITAIFSDTKVKPSITLEKLDDIGSHVDGYIDCLREEGVE